MTYTTVQGDMWDSIAFSQLGDVNCMDKLINLNLQYREYYVFPAGITLTLPDAPPNISTKIPPWKRVLG